MHSHNAAVGAAHLWTAGSYYIIGSLLIGLACWIWWTDTYRRAFIFGPYVTPEGIKALLANWPFVFLFGAFIFSCALDHHIDYLRSKGRASIDLLEFVAIVEASISVWTALSIVFVLVRTLVRRWTKS